MIAKRGYGIDRLNDVPAKIAGMRGREPDPPNSGDFTDGSQEFRESLPGQRVAVRIDILAQQLDFRVAQISHLARFREN
jgi:hypothetical protein